MDTKRFYSNGKLLLTGEYAVLDGAEALAVPTKFGQDLIVVKNDTKKINWKSYDADETLWYSDSFTIDEITNNVKHSNVVTQTLWDILRVAHDSNSTILNLSQGYDVITRLTFSRAWGLGTSSTLINNIAQWFTIDAFELLQKSFGGSGYDIACAQINSPLFYHIKDQKALFNEVNFDPSYKEQLFFVYLNQKRNSREAIQAYRQKKVTENEIEQVTLLTRMLYKAQTLKEFQDVIDDHEAFLSKIIDTPPIKDELFEDFSGSIKSLGAWGGDFVLVASNQINAKEYFLKKGYNTILSYDEMVL